MRLAAILLLAGAVALLALAAIPRPHVHAFLDARAGHVVTEGYVDLVRMRAAICGAGVLLIAIGAWKVKFGSTVAMERLPWPSPAAMIIIAIGAAARAILLFGPLHYDEAFTVTEFASKSPLFFLTRYLHANNHVFHTLLVWAVHVVAGNRMWALRLPAFAFGVALLYATYLLARRVAGERAALLATALAAAATPLVEYSAQARGYTILTFAFLLLFLIDDDRVRALLVAVGAWTIPTMLFAAAAWATWMAITQRAWRRIAFVAAASAALSFLLYVPILVVSGLTTITANGNVQSVSYAVLGRELPRSFAETFRDWNISFTLPLAIVIAAAAVVAVVRRRPAGVLFASALLAIVPLLLLTRKVPFPRVWIFVLPLYLIAAADSLALLPRTNIVAVALALLLSFNALRETQRYDFLEDPAIRDIPRIVDAIRALPPEGRVLVTSPLDAPFHLYVPERIIEDRFDSDPAAVRAAMAAAPRRYFAASTRPGGMTMYEELRLPYALAPITRFPHAVLFELRSR